MAALHYLFYDCNVDSRNKKKQVDYLGGYLNHKNVKTVLIENEYIDRFYLEDYSEYYVRCFTDYTRTCKRFHFFKDIVFTEAEFIDFLSGNFSPVSETVLKEKYVGFVVVKPLPETIIGRTCLEAYEEDDDPFKRYYPVTREYEIGLFGIKLRVNKTLPFQEQDRVVSACATSALWTLFHAAASIKSYHVKSPVQITKTATSLALIKRAFPSQGLTVEMMGNVLVSEGFDPLHVDLSPIFAVDPKESLSLTKEYTYAYQKHKIPLILGVDIYRRDVGEAGTASDFVHLGKHAVTICGFSINEKIDHTSLKPDEFHTRADAINKIYVHDDQLGPFARIEFGETEKDPIIVKVKTKESAYDGEVTSFLCNKNNSVPLDQIMLPNNIVAGLYHKIRIPYNVIRETARHFNNLLVEISKQNEFVKSFLWPETANAFEWDIHLTSATEMKEEVRASRLSSDDKKKFLTKHLPRFLWRAKAIYEGNDVFDLIFDATDIPQGKIFIESVEYDEFIKDFFVNIFGDGGEHLPANFTKDKSLLLYKVIMSLGTRRADVRDELSEKYGKERYPQYIKEHEFHEGLSLKEIAGTICLDQKGAVNDITLDESTKYLWAITISGELLIGPEVCEDSGKLLGHPNLLKGQKGRICGELFYDAKSAQWEMNNASGRYSKYSPDLAETRLNNAKDLLESFLPILTGNITTKVSSYHGKFTINTPEEAHIKIEKGCDSYRKYAEYYDFLATQVICSVVDIFEESIVKLINLENNYLDSYFLFLVEYWRRLPNKANSNLVNTLLSLYKDLSNELKTGLISALLSGITNDKIDSDQKESVIVLLKTYKDEMKECHMTNTYIMAHKFLTS